MVGFIRAGGMGAVHDAIDHEHGGRVALKTLTHLSPDNLLRFKTEFRGVADVSHENLVPLYELACHDGLWFFTMERIDGSDFLSHLRGPWVRPASVELGVTRAEDTLTRREASAPLSVPTRPASPPSSYEAVRTALAGLARGVSALHAAGLLHLDIKPSNVLVDRVGRVVVLDFGLARPIGATPIQRGQSTVSGTPGWMAPELLAGERVTEATDWYAVGLMLYLALTGVPAFAHGSLAATAYAQLHEPPRAPDQLLPETPADLSRLALALLDPDPARRPTGDELVRLTSNEAPPAPPVPVAISALVGREDERALLDEIWARVAAGGAAVVHLSGPSGVGKSALLAKVREDAARAGALTLHGRCYERESVPYKAFDGLIDQLSARLVASPSEVTLPAGMIEMSRVFPVLATIPSVARAIEESPPISGTASAIDLRRRAVEALRALVITLAASAPLVLAIDDLQWADGDSVAMLVKLLEAPAPRGLLVAVTLRPAEAAASPSLAAYRWLTRPGAGRTDLRIATLDVGPLRPAEAERLARATLIARGVDDETLARSIATEAEGIPFFIEELAHFAVEQGDAPDGAMTTGVALGSVLSRRLAALRSDERALVDVLAVADSPILVSSCFAVAGVDTGGARRALWALGGGHFVRTTGGRGGEQAELHHDRMREAALSAMTAERKGELHAALGKNLRALGGDSSPWLFDAVRHLNTAADRLDAADRRSTARLDLAAGRRARRAAAFPLAHDCFRAGARLLDDGAWTDDYALALALHGGAAETAYLSGAFDELDQHVSVVKSHARTVLDQLVAWEVEIDAHIARRQYAAAVDAALAALLLLDVALPPDPGEAEVGAEVSAAMEALAKVGPDGMLALAPATSPEIVAGMRTQSRISSAAYFARPMLFPVIACRLVTTSIEHGLSPATPYALAVYGVVLNSLGMLREAHTWGQVALALLQRFDDRTLVARTMHVVHDLVCTFTVPLAGTLDELRRTVTVGRETGDLEYAAYAAHAWVHNSFYAGKNLEPLLADALEFGRMMRGFEQVNALHVHTPFEQLLRAFTGRLPDAACLDGDAFDERTALAAAEADGSRSALCIVRLLTGIARYHFGSATDASALFEAARPYLDGVVSTWHVPMFHQYAALAIWALPPESRAALRDRAAESLAAVSAFAQHGAHNFAHRVDLIEGERARAEGDLETARASFDRAIERSKAGGFVSDEALAHELAARCNDGPAAAAHRVAARDAYARWGATEKVRRLTALVGGIGVEENQPPRRRDRQGMRDSWRPPRLGGSIVFFGALVVGSASTYDAEEKRVEAHGKRAHAGHAGHPSQEARVRLSADGVPGASGCRRLGAVEREVFVVALFADELLPLVTGDVGRLDVARAVRLVKARAAVCARVEHREDHHERGEQRRDAEEQCPVGRAGRSGRRTTQAIEGDSAVQHDQQDEATHAGHAPVRLLQRRHLHHHQERAERHHQRDALGERLARHRRIAIGHPPDQERERSDEDDHPRRAADGHAQQTIGDRSVGVVPRPPEELGTHDVVRRIERDAGQPTQRCPRDGGQPQTPHRHRRQVHERHVHARDVERQSGRDHQRRLRLPEVLHHRQRHENQVVRRPREDGRNPNQHVLAPLVPLLKGVPQRQQRQTDEGIFADDERRLHGPLRRRAREDVPRQRAVTGRKEHWRYSTAGAGAAATSSCP